jgi:4-hydroxy-tetrahydrodipicolinate reductase
MINAALLGACGRMGSLIVETITCFPDIQLVAAFDISNFGKDVGEFTRVGNLGIKISDVRDLEAVLKKNQVDVLIDFTAAMATAVNAPIAARCGPQNNEQLLTQLSRKIRYVRLFLPIIP